MLISSQLFIYFLSEREDIFLLLFFFFERGEGRRERKEGREEERKKEKKERKIKKHCCERLLRCTLTGDQTLNLDICPAQELHTRHFSLCVDAPNI